MNLINELNERRYSIEELSNIYYKEILKSVKNFKQSGEEISEDSYYKFAESDTRLDHVNFEEFKELVEINTAYEKHLEVNPVGRFSNIPGGVTGTKYRNEMRDITNKALIRRLSQDMCEDAKTILDIDYTYLCKLGYLGEVDEAIPEIVRGNFLMYAKKVVLRSEVIGCNEAIDRMQYALKIYNKHGAEMDEDTVERLFVRMPIDNIRKSLGSMKCPPVDDFREGFLGDFHEEAFNNFKNGSFDVENRKESKMKEMMEGNTFVTEKDYKEISDLSYDGRGGHPLIQSGYRQYVDIYVWDKVKKNQLIKAKYLYSDVCGIPGAREHLESPEIPDSWNCMSDLRDFIIYQIERSKYNKGKIPKTEFEKVKAIKERNDRYATPIRLAKMIGGLKNVSFDNREEI